MSLTVSTPVDLFMQSADAAGMRSVLGLPGTDVAIYGASPAAPAAFNATAINTALAAGGVVTILAPGTYHYNATAVIKAKTTLYLAPGVVLDYTGANYSAIRNEGALSTTNAFDDDIKIIGHGATIKVSGSASTTQDVPGMNGHLSFYNVRRLRVEGLTCTDLGASRFFLHLANHFGCELAHLYVTGQGAVVKDGVKFSGGERWILRDSFLYTTDDPWSCCAWDYSYLAPRIQRIRNGRVIRCVFGSPPNGTAAGYAPRILPAIWAAWSATSYVEGDVANSGGYQYRRTNAGTSVASVAPSHTSTGQKVTGADGIQWLCCGTCNFTRAAVENITVEDCRWEGSVYCSITANADAYGRSIFPGQSSVGLVRKIRVVRPQFAFPATETTPVFVLGIHADDIELADAVMERDMLPSTIWVNLTAAGRLIMRNVRIDQWHAGSGFVQNNPGGSFATCDLLDCCVEGKNDGASFQGLDGLVCYNQQANGLGRVNVRGGEYRWLTSFVRSHANGNASLDVTGATLENFRRLFVATSGTGASSIAVRGNYLKTAATLGLWGSTVAGQTIQGIVAGNTGVTSKVVNDVGGASRVPFADMPVITANRAGAAGGDCGNTITAGPPAVLTGWMEYNGAAWGASRN